MPLYQTNPLTDPRWAELVAAHPRASLFHSTGWLRALQQTYGYEPVVVTSSPPGSELRDGILFCKVRNRFDGVRLVSLPFSDHCEPLAEQDDHVMPLLAMVNCSNRQAGYKSIEVRPAGWRPDTQVFTGFRPSSRYYLHMIDLGPELPLIFGRLHKDCIQRKIRRAEREQLRHREGNSEALLKDFYGLFLYTRRRHGVPPQPWSWFTNLCANMGEMLKIRVAYKDGQAVAGIVTLSHRQSMVYKYGCSDPKLAKLGGMAFLFWKAIQDAKQQAMQTFDLGRSDLNASGLIAFKERLGAARQVLTYITYPRQIPRAAWQLRLAQEIFRRLPDPLLVGAGKLLYRYVG